MYLLRLVQEAAVRVYSSSQVVVAAVGDLELAEVQVGLSIILVSR